MNTILWILQIVVALVFLIAGSIKVFRYDLARQRMSFVPDVPRSLVTFIGTAEILGAIGLIIPAVTGVLPWLTIVSAVGLAVVMLLANLFNMRRGEYSKMITDSVLLVLTVFIAYGRAVVMPF